MRRSCRRVWMPGLRRIVWSVALLAACLAWVGPVRGQGGGTLAGRVENGTTGGAAIGAGLPVTLHILDGEAEREALETTTDAGGSFRFEALDADPALAYWPEVTYQGVAYAAGEGLAFAEGESELQVALAVYDTTDDAGGVQVVSVHMIAESFEQVLRISEVHVLGSTADRTFVGRAEAAAGGRVVTVFIPLPEGAVGVAFPEGEAADRYVQVEGGLWDTEPVLPGTDGSTVRFSYHLMVKGSSLPLERQFDYPVSSLSVLVVQPGLTARGEQLLAGEPITFQDREYQVFQAMGVGTGQPLRIELVPTTGAAPAGMPAGAEAAQPVGQQATLRWLGLGLVLLAAAAAFAYPFLVRPRGRP